ncbi:hypothetical protein GCM10025868_18620 [Angustibacter aerolatus]|uniref:Uncharacterized protein n=1 Tax=Angustibacter aerolatus TaxID=1162965 RepID=A0ABQ6JIC3_9ACTN|nr:hypothetical protein GCM10025868_18620 [Angustibacter aerolatus]
MTTNVRAPIVPKPPVLESIAVTWWSSRTRVMRTSWVAGSKSSVGAPATPVPQWSTRPSRTVATPASVTVMPVPEPGPRSRCPFRSSVTAPSSVSPWPAAQVRSLVSVALAVSVAPQATPAAWAGAASASPAAAAAVSATAATPALRVDCGTWDPLRRFGWWAESRGRTGARSPEWPNASNVRVAWRWQPHRRRMLPGGEQPVPG